MRQVLAVLEGDGAGRAGGAPEGTMTGEITIRHVVSFSDETAALIARLVEAWRSVAQPTSARASSPARRPADLPRAAASILLTPPVAAPPVPPPPPIGGMWTPERDAIVRGDIPANVPMRDILADLNAFDGPPIERSDVLARAAELGVSRPGAPEVPPRRLAALDRLADGLR